MGVDIPNRQNEITALAGILNRIGPGGVNGKIIVASRCQAARGSARRLKPLKVAQSFIIKLTHGVGALVFSCFSEFVQVVDGAAGAVSCIAQWVAGENTSICVPLGLRIRLNGTAGVPVFIAKKFHGCTQHTAIAAIAIFHGIPKGRNAHTFRFALQLAHGFVVA